MTKQLDTKNEKNARDIGVTEIKLDFPVVMRPRWTEENPHRELYNLINKRRNIFKNTLNSFLKYKNYFLAMSKLLEPPTRTEPTWNNWLFEGLDAIALYSFLVENNPEYYVEIGSGHSTKFAFQAIKDHKLLTKIISIDPEPRTEINSICDQVIQEPIENIDLIFFKHLKYNSILFIDSSHRVFMNSDVTTICLDIIPKLAPGILVHFHDIFLPYDYPIEWSNRCYSEQYIVATYLLEKCNRFEIMLANQFIDRDLHLKNIILPLLQMIKMPGERAPANSLWLKTK